MEHETAQLPLLTLFHTLQEAELPLGIDDYLALVRALQAGFGLSDRQSLARLCHALWVKSPEDEALLKYHFGRIFRRLEGGEGDQARPGASSALESDEAGVAASVVSSGGGPSQLMPIQLPPQGGSGWRAGLVPDYQPLSQRQMKQIWRQLSRPRRQGAATELDVDATIKRVGVTGSLGELVLIPPRTNRTSLLILIDQGGSMTPFEPLSRRLVETVVRGGRIGSVEVAYFHNCPIGYLYRDPYGQEALPQQLALEEASRRQAGLIIVSDAGAARGSTSTPRIAQTEVFLEQARQHVRYLAWLNPLPRRRWANTSARAIAALVPMFPWTRRGFDAAVDILRGRTDPTAS